MTIAPSARKKASGKAERAELLPPRELRGIIETVLRLAKSTEAVETEVHVDEVADALTRFANNGIHQNVFEHVVTVSVRTAAGGRTARATTNRLDEDSLRAAIEASLSLAHSQPRDPKLLQMCATFVLRNWQSAPARRRILRSKPRSCRLGATR